MVQPRAAEASSLVAELFGTGSGRYRHMRGAAHTAQAVAPLLLSPDESDLVVAAAWLHDVGYAEPRTGFHPVDGAELLLRRGWPHRLAALVAHHSFAGLVAPGARAQHRLAFFPAEPGLVPDLLVYADMSVDPDGAPMLVAERLADIARRHGDRTPTGRVHERRAAAIVAAVERVDDALARRYAPAATA